MQIYCNNCDKTGHSFHNCRKPIVSYGIITFRENNNEIEYLTVCRKHTFGYIDFMRGKYFINNKNQIMDIIFEMTNKEKENILTLPFLDIWKELWGSPKNQYFQNEKTFANEKFNILKRGVTVNNEYYNTESLIKNCSSSWDAPEWGFPKGRKNFKEEAKVCGLREWSEETGFDNQLIDIIDNVCPFDEIIIGSNYQAYRDSYFLAKFDNTKTGTSAGLCEPIHYQKSEISDAKWVTYEELLKTIRPYHLERIKIVKKVDSLLNKKSLYTIYG